LFGIQKYALSIRRGKKFSFKFKKS